MDLQVHYDVVFSDCGTVVLFTPLTRDGDAWFEDRTEVACWQRMGPSVAVDHRPAQVILDAMLTDGLRVAPARITTITGRA